MKEEGLFVLEAITIDAPKTKEVINILNGLKVEEKALIVLSENDETVARSANNLQNVKVLTVEELNVLDLLTHDKLIITKDAAEKAGEVLA